MPLPAHSHFNDRRRRELRASALAAVGPIVTLSVLTAAYALSAQLSTPGMRTIIGICIGMSALACAASAQLLRTMSRRERADPERQPRLRSVAIGLQVFCLCVIAAFGLVLLLTSQAHAHDVGTVVPARQDSGAWWLVTGLALCVALYARGYQVLRTRLGMTLRRGPLRALFFALAVATLVVALLSPLDAWSDTSFAAHMIQHELLMLVAAPLLVLARPLEPYFWSLPSSARTRVLRWVRGRAVTRLFVLLTAPGVALLVHGAVRWLWHIPVLFEACLHHEALHGVQHASFFITAVAFWWALLQGMHGRIGYGVAVCFVFATALHTGALGALITFARHPWYPSQSPFGNALVEQQLGGVIMWIVGGTLLTGLALALFVAWLGQMGRRRPSIYGAVTFRA